MIKYLDSGINFEGKIYDSNFCGKFVILGEVLFINKTRKQYGGKRERYFEIQFLNTGYRMCASYTAIRQGRIKDKFLPSVAGIGFIGSEINVTDPENHIFYRSWNDMINRCYNPIDNDYPMYGGMGIKVDPRWFNFTLFREDVKFLPGYENKLIDPTHYELDKDYLQYNIPKSQRIYSPSTCIWISSFNNKTIMSKQLKVSSTGYHGVIYKDNAYCTRIDNIVYGRFTIPEAAANLYNYIYPKLKPNAIMILNDVVPIPYNELQKYTINKQRWLNDYPEEE